MAILVGLLYEKEQVLDVQSDCIESLSFEVKEGAAEETIIPFYSQKDNMFYLFLPSYADTSNVRIYFEGAEKITFEEAGESHELKKGMTMQNLQLDKVYQTAFVKNSQTERETQFMMMRSAFLPTLFIQTQSGTMETVDTDKSYQEPGNYVLMDAEGALVYADNLDHITGRGNSTWKYPKKSYSIKLANPADLLGMGSARAWILLSNVEDITYLRNKITYDMAVSAGMTGAPESRYIDLYINNEYNGMYLLCEKIEPGENRIPMTDLGLENKKLNKEIQLSESVYTERSKGVYLEKNPKDISGGYIIERDEYSKYTEEISGFQSSLLGDLYVIKSPEYASAEEVAYISGLFAEMEEAIVAQNGVNQDTGESYLHYIDLQSFAQKYMIEEICKNNGGGATSSYFYKPEDAVSTKIFGGPVWDYDKAYGAVDGINDSRRDLCYLTQRNEGTTLFWYLNQQPEFKEAVSECYEKFFADYLTEVLNEKIEEYMSQMHCSADMDVIRWQEIYGIPEPYEKRVSVITDFITERKAFLDEVWLQDAEVCTVHFVAPEWYRDTYMSAVKGECLTAIPMQEKGQESNGRIFEGWYTESGEEFDMAQPLYEDVTVYAKSHEVSDREE
ncbi:MAG: CotH kinase family protein [Lachnospiraceae bacterium]|nr:CotH kinase family protein [Lachnospiraceae bacterium]